MSRPELSEGAAIEMGIADTADDIRMQVEDRIGNLSAHAGTNEGMAYLGTLQEQLVRRKLQSLQRV